MGAPDLAQEGIPRQKVDRETRVFLRRRPGGLTVEGVSPTSVQGLPEGDGS